jgi:hypothetical protein
VQSLDQPDGYKIWILHIVLVFAGPSLLVFSGGRRPSIPQGAWSSISDGTLTKNSSARQRLVYKIT